MFDKTAFLGTTTTAAGSTEYSPIPVNDAGYIAVVEKIDARQDTFNGELATMLDVHWVIQDTDGSVELATGLKKNTVRQSFFLDLTPAGGLDMSKGKNVQLNKLRDTFGQNVDGKPWGPSMLVGNIARIWVKHTPSKTGDGKLYTNVEKFGKM